MARFVESFVAVAEHSRRFFAGIMHPTAGVNPVRCHY